MGRASSLALTSFVWLLVSYHVVAAKTLTCAELSTQNYNATPDDLPAGKTVLSVTSAIVPASGNTPEFCQVDLLLSASTRVRVGLPTKTWNSRIENLGGAGFYGDVGDVTGPVQQGYVGSATNGGHDGANINDSSWLLKSDGTLARNLLEDYAVRAHQAQYQWANKLVKLFYGAKAKYTYFNGVSGGGRVSILMAQMFPQDFDGVVVGAPAMNFDRLLPSMLYPALSANIINKAQISDAKLKAVTAAAIAACDGLDGVQDGIINDERLCHYNAEAFVCKGSPGDPPNCLTATEASAVNQMWEGPHDRFGRLWFGISRGASLASLKGPAAHAMVHHGTEAVNSFPVFSNPYFTYWLYQQKGFDFRKLSFAQYLQDFHVSEEEYHSIIGSDDPNLEQFKEHGGKIIMYHGLYDDLIPPGGSYNYYDRVLAVMGGEGNTQDFFRFYPVPGASHGAPEVDVDWFKLLTDWVEQNVPPNPVARYNSGIMRPLCAYPKVIKYSGGDPNDASSFTCVEQNPALVQEDSTLPEPSKVIAPPKPIPLP